MPTYVDRVCENCGAGFQLTLSRANQPGKGRYCSRPCANEGQKRETVTSRYKYVKVRTHPLLPGGGRLPEHRFALYAKIGPGSHPCHWCRKMLSWEIQAPAEGSIVTDHLDDDGRNNTPGNIVPSCHRCNITRTHDRRFLETPFVISTTAGTRRAAVELTCATCGNKFLKEVALLNKGENTGKYCSIRCLWDRNKSK